MADEPKRLTATELRQQQLSREIEERARAQAEERSRQEAQRTTNLTSARAQLAKVMATWHDTAVAASQRPGVRFVVLAQLVGKEAGDAAREVLAEFAALEFTGAISDLQLMPPQTSFVSMNVPDLDEHEVYQGSVKGWRPAKTPRIAVAAGTGPWLIVKWAE